MFSATVRAASRLRPAPPPYPSARIALSCRRVEHLSIKPTAGSLQQFSTSALCRVRYRRFEERKSEYTVHQNSSTSWGSNEGPKRTGFWSWPRRDRIITVTMVLAGVYYLAHLEKMPETGRWRFMDMSKSAEEDLWERSIYETLEEYNGKIISQNHPISRRVQRVAARILEANNLGTIRSLEDLPDRPSRKFIFGTDRTSYGEKPADVRTDLSKREWNLLVVHDLSMVNAMAMPGTIVVFTGLLRVLPRDDAYLAAVLGHEVSHVVLRHTVERMSSARIFLPVTLLIDWVFGMWGLGRLANALLWELPNSRTAELEADKIGLELSSLACYDPHAAPQVFKIFANLERQQGTRTIEFLQTHPASEHRVQELEQQMSSALSIRASSPACANEASNYSAFRDFYRSTEPEMRYE